MKKYILFFSLFLISFAACNKEDEELESLPLVAITDTAIVGEWKLVETKIGDGGSIPNWENVDNIYTIEFLENGSFNRTDSNCNTGTYFVKNNPINEDQKMIELTYSCEMDQNNFPENKSYLAIEILNDNYLVYHPTYKGPICIEGCSYKLKKL